MARLLLLLVALRSWAVLWMVSEDSGLMTGSVIQFDQSVWGAYEDTPTPSSEMTYA